MISLIYYYVKKIIFFLIFSSFVQILFLNNKFKNYLQLVLNLILIFIMLDPLVDISNSIRKGSISEYIKIVDEKDFNIDEEFYSEIQNKMLLELFTENIKSQTQNIIGSSYDILDIELELMENSSYQTVIKRMDIYLSKNGEKLVFVKPFSSYNDAEEDEAYQTEIKNLKILISNFYNLSLENIFITIT